LQRVRFQAPGLSPTRAFSGFLGKVSIMPQGLDTQMTRQELADLLAFLQGLK
jgi:hypothetical protein